MIDKAARNRLSESLRHLVSGQITNDQFEDNSPHKSGDRAIWAIRLRAWMLYDDLKEYKLNGEYAIPAKGKSEIAKWLLFLKTNLDYEWPIHPSETLLGMLVSLLSFGLIPRIFWNGYWLRSENSKIWPFIRTKDFRIARRTPKLLKG